MEKKFSIKVISDSCGIKTHTIRAWEQRYGIFSPERSPSGQRLYSEEELQKAKLLARLVERGHPISSLADYSLVELEATVGLMESSIGQDTKLLNKSKMDHLFKNLFDYKTDKVADELQHLRSTLGAKDFIFSIVIPALREIGILTMKGSYTVTQEHIISTIIRDQLSQIYLPNVGEKRNEIALATPDGNLHELSIIIAEILCRANRAPTRYFGASHPADALAEAINALGTPTLILGVLSSDKWNYEKDMVKYLLSLDKELKRNVTIILGAGKKIEMPSFENIKAVKFIESFEDLDDYLKRLILK